LITFTAMRPDFGLSKARESLCKVAHASSSISALSGNDCLAAYSASPSVNWSIGSSRP
jgi:hypothetical protein